jgi:hypothetical protein
LMREARLAGCRIWRPISSCPVAMFPNELGIQASRSVEISIQAL